MIGILLLSHLFLNEARASVTSSATSEIEMRIDSEVNALDSSGDSSGGEDSQPEESILEEAKREDLKLEELKAEEVDWEWNRFCLRVQLDAGLVIPGFVSATIVPEVEFVFERD